MNNVKKAPLEKKQAEQAQANAVESKAAVDVAEKPASVTPPQRRKLTFHTFEINSRTLRERPKTLPQ